MAKKPTVTTLASGFNSTETLNANFENVKESFGNTLSLDGSTPNAMEASLDLNNNDIINAGVIGASSLVVNGKLISVSNDPVYDGTISTFGASLIDDVDAATARTTLGLSTVAATGSYTDLSNQPSFASPAQGALADSSVQPTDTQATSAWTTGTSTTEGIVSPLKVASAIDALAFSSYDLNSDGYLVLGMGLEVVWGTFSSTVDNNQTVDFHRAFTNECWGVAMGGFTPALTGTLTGSFQFAAKVLSKTQFLVDRNDTISGIQDYTYIAWGK